MRENKEKTVASGDEDVAAPTAKVASVQAGKRKSKSISSTVDLDDLPSRRGHKKQKPRPSLPKVPKFVPPTVNLDEPVVDVEPVQTIHPAPSDPPPAPKTSHKPGSSESSDRPSNLVLDEGYAWRTFKGIVTEHKVNECYNMSVKEFERSGIHDLFKVSFFLVLVCKHLILNEMSNSFSSKCRLCQSFIQQPVKPRSLLQMLRRPRIRLRS